MSEASPWRDILACASMLGIGPAEFWRLSLREWRALTRLNDKAALSRPQFDMLMKQFPDR